MGDRFKFHDGTVLLNVHTQEACNGRPCCIHNPSQHHMIHWDPIWDSSLKQMWRECPHGYQHPDPDDLTYWRIRWGHRTGSLLADHPCDGCCQPGLPEPQEIVAPVVPPPAQLPPEEIRKEVRKILRRLDEGPPAAKERP